MGHQGQVDRVRLLEWLESDSKSAPVLQPAPGSYCPDIRFENLD